MQTKQMLMGAVAALALGVSARDPDDQIRCTSYVPCRHDLLMEMGFNLLNMPNWVRYNFAAEAAGVSNADMQRTVYARLAKDGAEGLVDYFGSFDASLKKAYPRLGADGQPITRRRGDGSQTTNVDAALPGCKAAIEKGAKAMGAACAGLRIPNLVGYRGLEEVRLSSYPSLDETARAAYRAATGSEIPEGVKGRAAPHWSKIKDFPKDRILDDDYPLLKYYRWFWQHGDGWSEANDLASAAFAAGYGRPVVSLYAPVQRMPYLWGIGGHNSHLSEWIYIHPHPFIIRYIVAEMQAAARGTGAAIIPGVDGMFYANILKPARLPAELPDWYKTWGNIPYATIPPSWASEAFWLMCARRSEGVALDVTQAIIGDEPEGTYWCEKTNDETEEAVREVMTKLAKPLGPLLKNMPERAPEVAILESYASALFTTSGPGFWDTRARFFGQLMVLAGLDQYALWEEEIARDGIPPSVKVILMPECAVLTRKTAEALRAFQARGGRLVAEKDLAPGLKADATLPEFAAELPHAHNLGREGLEQDAAMRAKAAEIKKLVNVPAYAESDNDAILVSVRSHGSADVVFAVNDKRTYGPYIGGWKTVLDLGVANAGEVRVRRTAGAVYDLVRHTAVPFASRDGETRIPVSYTTTDGRALLVTARPLAPLRTSVTAENRLRVTSADRDVMVPFGVYAANGKLLVSGILRDGAWERPLDPAAFEVINFATGERTRTVPRVKINMSGFSKVACNEEGVRRLKAIGADSASGVRMDDTATLDLFLKYGLRATVTGFPSWWGGGKNTPPGTMAEKRPLAVFEKALAKFRPHPAIGAIEIGDEPSKLDFAHFGKVMDLVASGSDGIPVVTAIFPDYGSLISIGDEAARAMLGTDSYADYVRSWCELVRAPRELQIDFYPYSAPAEKHAEYFLRRFKTLEAGAKCAKEFGLAYSPYVQSNSLFPEMEMTLPRLRYMAFTDLAYGAEVLNFTCYTPSWWKNNILTDKGEPTARYVAVQRLIREIRRIDNVYMRYRYLGTRYLGFSEADLKAIGGASEQQGYKTAFERLTPPAAGRILVGDFVARDGSGRAAMLVTSADEPEIRGTNTVCQIGLTLARRPNVLGTLRRKPVIRGGKQNAWTLTFPLETAVLVEQ